jgi:dTDP-glucose pyrophosphorylase
MNDLALVIPAAGRGSRFARIGICEPKPLVDLYGRPFFWWAVESVRRVVNLRQMVFVVLEEHITEFFIDKKIKSYYPDATIVAIPEVTGGAAETAKIGLDALVAPGPVAINDCDHAFICQSLPDMLQALQNNVDGALMCFQSSDPAYSYIKLDLNREVIGTVEKQVVSPFAIAGCYLFSTPTCFNEVFAQYRKECPYNELFLSGLFNLLTQNHARISMLELDRHCSFGTPEELTKISKEVFSPFLAWK